MRSLRNAKCARTRTNIQEAGFTRPRDEYEHSEWLINAKLSLAHSVVMEQDGELTVPPLHSLNDKWQCKLNAVEWWMRDKAGEVTLQNIKHGEQPCCQIYDNYGIYTIVLGPIRYKSANIRLRGNFSNYFWLYYDKWKRPIGAQKGDLLRLPKNSKLPSWQIRWRLTRWNFWSISCSL